ncbi:Serine protease [Mycolicibacterium frederiksbergense]
MHKPSSITVGVIALTAAILGTAPTVSATPPAPASAVETVADPPGPDDGVQANGSRSGRQKSVDTTAGTAFTPPVTAPQATVDPYND